MGLLVFCRHPAVLLALRMPLCAACLCAPHAIVRVLVQHMSWHLMQLRPRPAAALAAFVIRSSSLKPCSIRARVPHAATLYTILHVDDLVQLTHDCPRPCRVLTLDLSTKYANEIYSRT